jgi:subtilisin family serine protease
VSGRAAGRRDRHRNYPIFELEPIERRVLLAGGSISGVVFSDWNSNGVRDAAEPVQAGWTVYLDSNDNGALDAGESSVVTGANGAYQFNNLAAAQHVIREIPRPGYVQSAPGPGGIILGGEAGAGAASGPAPQRSYDSNEIVVALVGGAGKSALSRKLSNRPEVAKLVDLGGSSDMYSVSGTTLVRVRLATSLDAQKVATRVRRLPGVSWAQVNYIYDELDPREVTPNDPGYPNQYHHPLMHNDQSWDIAQGDARVIVAVTDDGVDLNHEDLYSSIWVNQAEIPPSRRGSLTDINGDGYVSMLELNDPINRGAFKANDVNLDGKITATDLLAAMGKVGGLDAGTGGWSDGVDQGANNFVDDISGRDFWNNDNDSSPPVNQNHGTHVTGILAANTNNGIGVAGTSPGVTVMPVRFFASTGGTWTSTIVSDSYKYAADNGAKIMSTSYNADLFVGDNIFVSGLQYMYDRGVLHFNSAGNSGAANPSRQNLDHSIYVVNTDAQDLKFSGSNYGWGIDVSAPGTSIYSTYPNNQYQFLTGTSMATPNVSAVAALVWSLHPTWTREQVAAQVLGTAQIIDAINPNFAGLLGAGRVDSFAALTDIIAPPKIKSFNGLPANGAVTTTKPTNFRLDVASVFDAATLALSSFELRGDGGDGVFNTADDYVIPIALTFGGSQSSQYMVGTNRLNFTIPGNMPPDTYRFSMLPTARDPFGQPLDANGDGVAGDAFTRTFTYSALSNPYRVSINTGQIVTGVNFGNHDLLTPKVLGSFFGWATAQEILVVFDDNVGASLSTADLLVQNLTTGQAVDTSAFTLTYDAVSNLARFSVNGILPDGDFRATLVGGGISDQSGNLLDANLDAIGGDNVETQFFFLQGDANRDQIVNSIDFNILASNFGVPSAHFGMGDFDYDRDIDSEDFNILAGTFGASLGGTSAAAVREARWDGVAQSRITLVVPRISALAGFAAITPDEDEFPGLLPDSYARGT